jgi:hypothetical protein
LGAQAVLSGIGAFLTGLISTGVGEAMLPTLVRCLPAVLPDDCGRLATVRYEFRREFAPYVGVDWNRKFFGTADLASAAGEKSGAARLAAGLRFWF